MVLTVLEDLDRWDMSTPQLPTLHGLAARTAHTTYLFQDTRGDIRKRNGLIALTDVCRWVVAISTRTRGAHDLNEKTHLPACS